uniref:Uncharacterized protein n=1 Tax=Oryza rufipogon TaxID=4529 RepID=A0A0E0Q914_ORYRU
MAAPQVVDASARTRLPPRHLSKAIAAPPARGRRRLPSVAAVAAHAWPPLLSSERPRVAAGGVTAGWGGKGNEDKVREE